MASTIRKVLFLIALPSLMNVQTFAQGTFQNLDFENGVFIPAPTPGNPFAVEFAPAMLGWNGYLGTNQMSTISHNALSLGVANIAIMGPDYPSPGLFHGQYYVQLQNSFPIATDVPALAQIGQLPSDAQSIQFLSSAPFAIGVFSIGVELLEVVVCASAVVTNRQSNNMHNDFDFIFRNREVLPY